MAKRNASRRDTIVAAFHNVLTGTNMISTATKYDVSPNSSFSARMLALADDFEEYKVTKLRYRLLPIYSINAAIQVASYFPGITDATPTFAGISENMNTAVAVVGAAFGTTQPTTWQSVPAATLAGMHSWYKTIPGSPSPAEEIQGSIYLSSNDTSAFVLEVEGEVVFRAPAAASSTPAARAEHARLRERERLLALLAPPTNTVLAASANAAPSGRRLG